MSSCVWMAAIATSSVTSTPAASSAGSNEFVVAASKASSCNRSTPTVAPSSNQSAASSPSTSEVADGIERQAADVDQQRSSVVGGVVEERDRSTGHDRRHAGVREARPLLDPRLAGAEHRVHLVVLRERRAVGADDRLLIDIGGRVDLEEDRFDRQSVEPTAGIEVVDQDLDGRILLDRGDAAGARLLAGGSLVGDHDEAELDRVAVDAADRRGGFGRLRFGRLRLGRSRVRGRGVRARPGPTRWWPPPAPSMTTSSSDVVPHAASRATAAKAAIGRVRIGAPPGEQWVGMFGDTACVLADSPWLWAPSL